MTTLQQPTSTTQNIAIDGFDTVAYFKEKKAIKGSARYQIDWNDQTWFFQNEQNYNAFQENPLYYAPQFQGACAFGMSLGKSLPGSPNFWSILDEKLYFSSNRVAGLLFKLLPGRIQAAQTQFE